MATKGVNPFAKFEKSKQDIETPADIKKYGKEGSKKEEAHDKVEMGMKKGGSTKKFAKGGGIESKGKTKGTVVTMKCGGKVK
jgi:hypothetical protein